MVSAWTPPTAKDMHVRLTDDCRCGCECLCLLVSVRPVMNLSWLYPASPQLTDSSTPPPTALCRINSDR